MGGSSSQVVGYRYYASFLAFIGNRIENFIGINFDKRGWHTGRRVSMGDNGEMVYLHLPNLYGENEGGISGTLCVKYGSNMQAPDAAYKKYMESISSHVSAYPYQSYISFTGGELLNRLNSLTEEQLQDLADQYNNGIIPGGGFYLGNSGYMKEMLLWVKRTRVRNDGRGQWYEVRGDGAVVCEIGAYSFNSNSNEFLYKGPFKVECVTEVSPQNESARNFYSEYTYTGDFNESDLVGGGWHIGSTDTDLVRSKSPINYSLIYSFPGFNGTANIVFRVSNYLGKNDWQIVGSLAEEYRQEIGTDGLIYIYCKFLVPESGICRVGIKGIRKINEEGLTEFGVTVMARMYECFTRPGGASIEAPDINVIHKIREILTDDTAMGKPESDVNDANFIKAADRIYDEGLGISWAIDEKSCIEAIEELCYHIEAGIRVNRQTGLYEMVLFRDDWFSEDEIHDIAENKIKDLSLEVMNSDDIVNQLNVTYYDRERIKNSTFSVYENGSILTMGHANAESVEFTYFMNMRNAEIVANWKLKQFSTPAWSGSFTTGWKEARKWNRYDLIRLPWSSKWNGTILVRIMKINLGNGTDNTVTIDFEEVIPYSGEMNTSIVVDNPVDSGPKPPQPSVNAVFEAPYYLTVLRAGQTNADLELSNNPDIGYVAAIAAKPQNNSLNALLFTDGGVGEFDQVSRLDYCDILQLDQPITETTSSFVVTGSLTQTANSNNLILLNDEWMGFVSFNDETKVLTVKRGVLDSGMPKKHTSGSIFIIDLPDVAFDSTQYAQGEIVEAQVLTTTPSGIQELSGSSQSVDIQSRAIRPYPPANVKINNTFMPLYIDGDLQITWSNRNRLQQTGGEILGYFEGSVALEPNTQTLLTVTELDIDDVVLATHSVNVTGTNTFTLLEANMQAGVNSIQIILKTVRDGYECLNIFNHTVVISNLTAPTDVTFEVIEI